jgi:DnaK suppressor protein
MAPPRRQPAPLHTPDLATLRAHVAELERLLLARRDEILGRTVELRRNLDEQVIDSPGDAADESVIDTSADYFLKLANTHQRELLQIRDAVERLRRGTYGLCETCENPIAIERLRRVPMARHCIACQSALERREAASRLRLLPKL